MADNETAERWTVPQACVWIYTRDLATVRELDPRAALSLSVAALAMPSVFDASACLLAALGRGYPTARARLEETDGYIPQTFWNDGGRFTDSPDHGVVIVAPGGQGSWTNVAVEADDCMGLWPSPAAILGDGVLSLGQAVAQLEPEPIDHPRWLLTHIAAIATGLNERAERVAVDPAALAHGVVDFEADTVTTRDGRLCWSQVTVELAPQPVEPEPALAPAAVEPTPAPLGKSARIGRPNSSQARAREYFARVYPTGTNATTRALREELEANKIYASDSTVERALERRRDSDRSSKARPK
jgi:hypothetical protein